MAMDYNDYIVICVDAWFNLEGAPMKDFLWRWTDDWYENPDESKYYALIDDIYAHTNLNREEDELFNCELDDERIVDYFLTYHNEEIESWEDCAFSDRFSQWQELQGLEYDEQIDFLTELWDNRYNCLINYLIF